MGPMEHGVKFAESICVFFYYYYIIIVHEKKEHFSLSKTISKKQNTGNNTIVSIFNSRSKKEKKTNRKDKRSIEEFTFWRNALKFHEKEERKATLTCFIIAVADVAVDVDVDSKKTISPALQCIYANTSRKTQ